MALQTVLFGKWRHQLMPLARRRYGDLFTIRIAPRGRKIILLARPEDIKTVFTGPADVFHAGEGNAVLGPVMGEHSVLLVDEAQHTRARRLLMPPFNGAALRGYRGMVSRLAAAEADRWPLGQPLRLHDRMNAFTLEVILQVVFGMAESDRLAELRTRLRRLVQIGPVIVLAWGYPKLHRYGPWRRYLENQLRVDELLYAEITDRRAARDLDQRHDVLSRLLLVTEDDGSGLTDAELRDQLITLLLAGHETTASALAWAVHDLARDPETLRKAQAAADSGDDQYLEAVIKEAMRLHPVISLVNRTLKAPVEIGGYHLPAHVTVAPSIALVQADPEHHPDPEVFRPERFLGTQPAHNTWIPFGGGIRRCLGAGFSLMEGTAALHEILTRYDIAALRPRPEAPMSRNITSVPSKGATVVLRPRG